MTNVHKIVTKDPWLLSILEARARRAAGRRAPLTSPVVDLGPDDRKRRAVARAASLGHGEFKTFGEFAQSVAIAALGDLNSRLVRTPTGAGEADPSSGGFMVPSVFIDELVGSIYEAAVVAPLCDRRETDRPNSVSLPAVDETSRADGSRWGGVLSYWKDEGTAPSTTLPKFKAMRFAGHKLIALCVTTNELLADVPLLEGHLRRAFAGELAFQLDRTILVGTGAGTPLEIVAAPATITVAKASGQQAGTIVAQNISDMWSRLPAPSRSRAVWIANEDAEGQLESMLSGGSASTNMMYSPAGANGNAFPLVKGRPLLIAEQCPTLGKVGDIILADLGWYTIISGGLKGALSLDVNFTSDQAVFRFSMRVDGKPTISAPITPYNGGSTRSPFVALAAR